MRTTKMIQVASMAVLCDGGIFYRAPVTLSFDPEDPLVARLRLPDGVVGGEWQFAASMVWEALRGHVGGELTSAVRIHRTIPKMVNFWVRAARDGRTITLAVPECSVQDFADQVDAACPPAERAKWLDAAINALAAEFLAGDA